MSKPRIRPALVLFVLIAAQPPLEAATTPHETLARRLLAELVEVNTSPSAGPAQTRVAAERMAGHFDDPVLERLDDFPDLNALVRTTCVATQLEGGHAENALPQKARAVVNCRVLPQSSIDAVETKLKELTAASGVRVKVLYPPVPSPPSPVASEVFEAVAELARQFWPGVPVLPQMATAATDGLYLRNAGIPTYTVDFIAEDPDEDRTHGGDERIRVDSFYTALEAWYRLLVRLAGPLTGHEAGAAVRAAS